MRNNERMNIMELYNKVKEKVNQIGYTEYNEILEMVKSTELYKLSFEISCNGDISIICQDWDDKDEEMIVAIGFSGGLLAYVEL